MLTRIMCVAVTLTLVVAPALYEGLPPSDSTIRASGAFGRDGERFVDAVYVAADPLARLTAAGPYQPIRLAFGCGDREPIRSDPAEANHELLAVTTSLYDRLRRLRAVEASLTVVAGGHDPSTFADLMEHGLIRLLGGLAVSSASE